MRLGVDVPSAPGDKPQPQYIKYGGHSCGHDPPRRKKNQPLIQTQKAGVPSVHMTERVDGIPAESGDDRDAQCLLSVSSLRGKKVAQGEAHERYVLLYPEKKLPPDQGGGGDQKW